MKLKLGLIINPIAGVGASLAWKGTDDVISAWKAVEAGEKQPIWGIARRAIETIDNSMYEWFLGGEFSNLVNGKVVFQLPKRSTSEDTKYAVKRMINESIDLLIFVGGDGTARDISEVAGNIPILGIPGGVKIFSPCFLHTPEDLGVFLSRWNGEVKVVDILDLNEDEYREGSPTSKLVGQATIPVSALIQVGKTSFVSEDDERTYSLIAERIIEEGWLNSKTIIVGPGSTMQQIFSHLDLNTSLLGVDIVRNGESIHLDCTESELNEYNIDEIWVTPIGLQGHIFGRGNKQIGLEIFRKLAKSNVRIFSTPSKIRNTPMLYLDIGTNDLNNKFKGYYHVVTGYHEEVMRKVE